LRIGSARSHVRPPCGAVAWGWWRRKMLAPHDLIGRSLGGCRSPARRPPPEACRHPPAPAPALTWPPRAAPRQAPAFPLAPTPTPTSTAALLQPLTRGRPSCPLPWPAGRRGRAPPGLRRCPPAPRPGGERRGAPGWPGAAGWGAGGRCAPRGRTQLCSPCGARRPLAPVGGGSGVGGVACSAGSPRPTDSLLSP
jgi:translation initiation factor IF-2